MSTSAGRRSILLACSVALGVACLDLSLTTVIPPDAGFSKEAQQRCRECVYGANGPAHSCIDAVTPCTQNAVCQSILACTFETGCYGQDKGHTITCTINCQDFVQRSDDPVVSILLPIYQCVTDGPCASACVPAEVGAGPTDDPAASAGDASAGGACRNAADQAIMSRELTDVATSCGLSCYASATAGCHRACVADQTGLSPACSACWGDAIQCGASSCLQQCLQPLSPACSACNAQYCTPAFLSCAGGS